MEERKERCIRCEKMRVGDLKHGFGNPRKITKKKAEELERSLEMFGDFYFHSQFHLMRLKICHKQP